MGDDFRFAVRDALEITGRGTYVFGTIETGQVAIGDTLLLGQRPVVCKGIEFVRTSPRAPGDPAIVALSIPELEPTDVVAGDQLISAADGQTGAGRSETGDQLTDSDAIRSLVRRENPPDDYTIPTFVYLVERHDARDNTWHQVGGFFTEADADAFRQQLVDEGRDDLRINWVPIHATVADWTFDR